MNEQQIPISDDEIEDVEGHMPFSKRHAFATDDSAAHDVDDVEGHVYKSGRSPAVDGDDDDVEGHGARPRI